MAHVTAAVNEAPPVHALRLHATLRMVCEAAKHSLGMSYDCMMWSIGKTMELNCPDKEVAPKNSMRLENNRENLFFTCTRLPLHRHWQDGADGNSMQRGKKGELEGCVCRVRSAGF